MVAPPRFLHQNRSPKKLFHFHFHAQKHDNGRFTAPGIGDLNYAENLRANCLVFTFINKDTLALDFYRHSRVIVDLAEIARPLQP